MLDTKWQTDACYVEPPSKIIEITLQINWKLWIYNLMRTQFRSSPYVDNSHETLYQPINGEQVCTKWILSCGFQIVKHANDPQCMNTFTIFATSCNVCSLIIDIKIARWLRIINYVYCLFRWAIFMSSCEAGATENGKIDDIRWSEKVGNTLLRNLLCSLIGWSLKIVDCWPHRPQ